MNQTHIKQPPSSPRQIVVIGGGIAGVSAAQAARNAYPNDRIILISEDPHGFYNRIALNSFITGKRSENYMYFYPKGWLAENRIKPIWGKSVQAIDPNAQIIVLETGHELPYDKLILATGASPYVPPIPGISSKKVLPLWSLDHACLVRDALKTSSRIAVLGGGVLGVEAALDIGKLNKKVTLIESEKRILPLHIGETPSSIICEQLNSFGVATQLNSRVTGITERKDGLVVSLNTNESFDTDMVLVTAGVRPNTTLATQAGLKVGRGIVVDDGMQTSDPHILACGNCAEIDGELQLLWNPAKSQGYTAGTNLFEKQVTLSPSVQSIHLKAPSIPLFVCSSNGKPTSQDKIIKDRHGNNYRLLVVNNQSMITKAVFLNHTSDYYWVEQAIRAKRIVSQTDTIQNILAEVSVSSRKRGTLGNGWVCQMCGYVHEGDNPPEICPVCAVGKDQFLAA